MKKLLAFTVLAALVAPVFAEDLVEKDDDAAEPLPKVEKTADSELCPFPAAVYEYPASADIIGIRFTIPFSTAQESVSGIDLGFWGESQYFEGVQLNLIRNNVYDSAAGFQVGLYNSVGRGDLLGFQAGLWNEAGCIRGFQVGLVNVVGEAEGFQVGIINRAETMSGYQVGVINIIRDAELQFMPFINIGF